MQQSSLNLIPSGDMPIIYASQYDNNRVIRFNLFDGEDEYTLSGTETVKCNIRKNDEHIVVIVPTIGANKYIDVYLTEQACACFGDNIGEITISSGEDNIIGTINFILKVERNPIQGGVTSASDIADLESQIEDIVHEVMTDDYYTRDEVDAKLDLKANASSVYTKSEVDTALASKANASDVYTKSQVDTALGLKADKADTYTKSEVDTALAAKANASDVYTKTEVDEMIDDLYPVNTASGSIATFTTSLALPLVAMSADIVAQQASGTPTPSNPLPISGFSSVGLTHTAYNSQSETKTIALGQTVYGGVIDAINGKVTITHDFKIFDGSSDENWRISSTNAYYSIEIGIDSMVANTVISNLFENIQVLPSSDHLGINNSSRYIRVRPSADALDLQAFKTWLSNNNLQVCYELATPIEITGLTPANFTTIAGEQNIFADCGDVEVSFKQGIQEYIDDKLGG